MSVIVSRLHLLPAVLALAFACAGVTALAPTPADAAKGRAAGSDEAWRYPSGATRPTFRAGNKALAAAKKHTKRKPHVPVLRGNPARGLRAFEAMQRNYYLLGSGLYKGEPFSYLWPFSQGMAATVSMSYATAIKKI